MRRSAFVVYKIHKLNTRTAALKWQTASGEKKEDEGKNNETRYELTEFPLNFVYIKFDVKQKKFITSKYFIEICVLNLFYVGIGYDILYIFMFKRDVIR